MEIVITELWLNDLYENKKKFTTKSLFDNFLSKENEILKKKMLSKCNQLVLKIKNLFEDFEEIHKCDALVKV